MSFSVLVLPNQRRGVIYIVVFLKIGLGAIVNLLHLCLGMVRQCRWDTSQ